MKLKWPGDVDGFGIRTPRVSLEDSRPWASEYNPFGRMQIHSLSILNQRLEPVQSIRGAIIAEESLFAPLGLEGREDPGELGGDLFDRHRNLAFAAATAVAADVERARRAAAADDADLALVRAVGAVRQPVTADAYGLVGRGAGWRGRFRSCRSRPARLRPLSVMARPQVGAGTTCSTSCALCERISGGDLFTFEPLGLLVVVRLADQQLPRRRKRTWAL